MTRSQAIRYALEAIPSILPLEETDVRNLCDQVLKGNGLNSENVAQGFLEVLGHSDLAFEFVIRFNELMAQQEQPQPVNEKINPQPVKSDKILSATRDKEPQPGANLATNQSVLAQPALTALTEPNSRQNSKPKPKANKKQLIQEIDEVWKFLELDHDEKNVKKYVCNCQGNIHPLFEAAPNCLSCGKIICAREGFHLVRCTFCGAEFIPLEERHRIVQLLKKEKEELISESTAKKPVTQQQQVNYKNKYAKGLKISSGMGTNLFSEQDKLFDLVERQRERERKREEVLRNEEADQMKEMELKKRQEVERELDPDLVEAQDRLNKLLHFQDTSAERTKIIDNATDFSISNDSGLWGTAQERALMLKKQQRNLRKWEKLEGERNGKREKYVVSMNIGANGKVTMKEVRKDHGKTIADSDDDIDAISDGDDLTDLKDIHKLKNEIEMTKEQQKSDLQTKVWDYEKDMKQFEPPKYVGESGMERSKDITHDDEEEKERKSRVQVGDDNLSLWELIA